MDMTKNLSGISQLQKMTDFFEKERSHFRQLKNPVFARKNKVSDGKSHSNNYTDRIIIFQFFEITARGLFFVQGDGNLLLYGRSYGQITGNFYQMAIIFCKITVKLCQITGKYCQIEDMSVQITKKLFQIEGNLVKIGKKFLKIKGKLFQIKKKFPQIRNIVKK